MINICFFIGRVSTEIQLRKTNNGTLCCNFQLAVSRMKSEDTDFAPLAAYGKIAEIISKYVKKGDLISVRASFRSKVKNNKKYLEFSVEEIEFLENKKAGEYDDIEVPSASALNDHNDFGNDEYGDLPF